MCICGGKIVLFHDTLLSTFALEESGDETRGRKHMHVHPMLEVLRKSDVVQLAQLFDAWSRAGVGGERWRGSYNWRASLVFGTFGRKHVHNYARLTPQTLRRVPFSAAKLLLKLLYSLISPVFTYGQWCCLGDCVLGCLFTHVHKWYIYCCWSPGEIHNSRAAPPNMYTGAARELCINNVCICISSIRFLLYNIDVTSTS